MIVRASSNRGSRCIETGKSGEERAVAGGLAGLLCWQGHLVECLVGRRAIVRNNKSLDAPGQSTTTPPFPLRHLLFLLPPLSLCLCSSCPPNNSKEHERRSPRYSHAFFTHNSIAPAAYQGTVYANRGVVHMDTAGLGGMPGPRCCCGSQDCAFLAHNGRLLEGLERDVSKAAQLGQV